MDREAHENKVVYLVQQQVNSLYMNFCQVALQSVKQSNVCVAMKNLLIMQIDEKENIIMGLNCKKSVGKMRSITRKLENQLADEAKLQKEKKIKKNNK